MYPLSTETNGKIEPIYELRLRRRTNEYSSFEKRTSATSHLKLCDITELKNDVDGVHLIEKKFPLTGPCERV